MTWADQAQRFIGSQTLRRYKEGAKANWQAILLVAIIVLDAALTITHPTQEANPIVAHLLLLGALGMIIKSATMGAATYIVYRGRNMNPFNRTVYTALFSILILLTATNIAVASGTNEWWTQCDDPTNRCFVNDGTGQYTNSTTTYCNLPTSTTGQPLVADFDDDGFLEILDVPSNSLKIYDGQTCLIKYELALGATIAAYPSMMDSQTIAIIGNDDEFKVIDYNFTTGQPQFKYRFYGNTSCASYTGVKCDTAYNCYAACAFGTTKLQAFRFDKDSYTSAYISGIAAINVFYGLPAVAPLTTTGLNNMVFSCDANNDGVYGICVLRGDTLALDTAFNVVGYKDNIEQSYAYATRGSIKLPVIYNLDGGYNELILSYTNCTENIAPGDNYYAVIRVLEYDGSTKWTRQQLIRSNVGGACNSGGTTSNFMVSNPAISFYDGGTDICQLIPGDNSGLSVMKGFVCYDSLGTVTRKNTTLFLTADVGNFQTSLTAADMTPYSSDMDLIMFRGIIHKNKTLPGITFAYPYYRMMSLADLDNDGSLEVLGSGLGSTMPIYSAVYQNNPPDLTGTRDYGRNYANPLCAGTTLTITAAECGSEPCHYSNDGEEDTERLAANCGTNTSLFYGAFAGAAPQISCLYPAAGSYSFNAYLQDQANQADLTQFISQQVLVVNGTPGITCNLLASEQTITGQPIAAPGEYDAENAAQGAAESFFDDLTQGSTYIATLFVIFLTLGLIGWFVYMRVGNALIYAVSVFALWMLLAMLGLLQWIYVIIFAFVAIGASAVFFVKGSVGGNGGPQ